VGERAGEDAVEEAIPPHRVVPQPNPNEGEHRGVDEREQHQQRRLPLLLQLLLTPRRRIVELSRRRGGGRGGRHGRSGEESNRRRRRVLLCFACDLRRRFWNPDRRFLSPRAQ
jgi:hypothetical protein